MLVCRGIFALHGLLLDTTAFLYDEFSCLPCGGFLVHVLPFLNGCIFSGDCGCLARVLIIKKGGIGNPRELFLDLRDRVIFPAIYWCNLLRWTVLKNLEMQRGFFFSLLWGGPSVVHPPVA